MEVSTCCHCSVHSPLKENVHADSTPNLPTFRLPPAEQSSQFRLVAIKSKLSHSPKKTNPNGTLVTSKER